MYVNSYKYGDDASFVRFYNYTNGSSGLQKYEVRMKT
jgi:hypothetical protein